jgi:antitoxin MazE
MEATHLTLDQAADVRFEQGQVIIEPVKPAYAIQALIAGITAENRHGEQDVSGAEGRELL